MMHHKALDWLEINGEAEICFQMLFKNPQRKCIPHVALFLMVLHFKFKEEPNSIQSDMYSAEF